MYILGNPLLSKIFSYSKIKLTEDGIYYTVKGNKVPSRDIFLTNSLEIICNLLEIDFSEINEKNDDQVFLFLIENSKASKRIPFKGFTLDKINDNTPELTKRFSKIVSTRFHHVENNDFQPILLQELMVYFPFLLKRIEEEVNIMNNYTPKFKRLINGKTLIDRFPKLVKSNIPDVLSAFKNLFNSTYELEWFITFNSDDVILQTFYRVVLKNPNHYLIFNE